MWQLVDVGDQPGQHIGIGGRRYAVTQVHDVTRGCLAAPDDVRGVAGELVPGAGEHGWVDVALERGTPSEKGIRLVQGSVRVDALGHSPGPVSYTHLTL